MKVMLDTNTVSDIITKKYPNVLENFNKINPNDALISVITAGELRFGIAKTPKFKSRQALIAFLDAIEIVPFDSNAAQAYGTMKAETERSGNAIAELDLLIAAHAQSLGINLISNDARLKSIQQITVIDWRE